MEYSEVQGLPAISKGSLLSYSAPCLLQGDLSLANKTEKLMSKTLQISSLLLVSLTFTAACDKDSKKRKNNNDLPANTAEITANSLARSKSLSQQLSPHVARSVQGFSQVNPADKMATLWSAVSGQPQPVDPNPLPALHRSFSSIAKQNAWPIRNLFKTAPDLEDLTNKFMENVLQEKHAEFMADGMIFYRLDGLNQICEDDADTKADCLKSLQSIRLGVGSYGDQGLSIQVNHLRQGIVTLKMEPSKVVYSMNLTPLNALLGPDIGLGFVGAFEGSWALTQSSSEMSLSLTDELVIATKDEETGEATTLAVSPHSLSMTIKQDLESNRVTSTLQSGRITLKSGKSRLEIPGFSLNTMASENAWRTSVVVKQGSIDLSFPSSENSGSMSTMSLAFDNDLQANMESNTAATGSFTVDAVNIRAKADGQNVATLSINPAVKAKLGIEGIKVQEGRATLVMDGKKIDLLQPQTCYRPVLDGTDDLTFDDLEDSSESFLDAVPCRA
jgi:hypothetical protein